jgi:hypothetical protein
MTARVDCQRFDELLMDFLYEELGPRDKADVAAHVDGCARCTAEIRRFRGTRATVQRLEQLEPPPAVSAKLLHMAAARRRSLWQRSRPVRWLAASAPVLAAAATILFVVHAKDKALELTASVPAVPNPQPAVAGKPAAPTSQMAESEKAAAQVNKNGIESDVARSEAHKGGSVRFKAPSTVSPGPLGHAVHDDADEALSFDAPEAKDQAKGYATGKLAKPRPAQRDNSPNPMSDEPAGNVPGSLEDKRQLGRKDAEETQPQFAATPPPAAAAPAPVPGAPPLTALAPPRASRGAASAKKMAPPADMLAQRREQFNDGMMGGQSQNNAPAQKTTQMQAPQEGAANLNQQAAPTPGVDLYRALIQERGNCARVLTLVQQLEDARYGDRNAARMSRAYQLRARCQTSADMVNKDMERSRQLERQMNNNAASSGSDGNAAEFAEPPPAKRRK